MASNEITSSNNNNNNMVNAVNDDHYDALSFCDLPMDNHATDLEPFFEASSIDDDNKNDDELFEFSTSPEPEPNEAIFFCGKSITNNNRLFVRRESSFKKSHSSRSDSGSGSGSGSFRFGGPPKQASSRATGGYYRTSSGGGSSSWSRKQRVMIGLVRLEPIMMELSDMRKRQGRRRSPVPLFPDTGGTGSSGKPGSGRNNWPGLLRPLRCRVHFVSALSKASFGCINSHA